MYYRLYLPPAFFNSSQVPQVSLFSGAETDLSAGDLDLSFVFSAPPSAQVHGEPVEELLPEQTLWDFNRRSPRRGSRNMLLTLPVRRGELGAWRRRNFWPLRAALLLPTTLGLLGAIYLRPQNRLGLASIALGLVLGWLAARWVAARRRSGVQFGVSPLGNVVVTLSADRAAAGRRYAAAVEAWLAAEAVQAEASAVAPVLQS
ncbi:MAG: hypothetical protein ACREJ2_14585 [Planctomycetota bacterium]